MYDDPFEEYVEELRVGNSAHIGLVDRMREEFTAIHAKIDGHVAASYKIWAVLNERLEDLEKKSPKLIDPPPQKKPFEVGDRLNMEGIVKRVEKSGLLVNVGFGVDIFIYYDQLVGDRYEIPNR